MNRRMPALAIAPFAVALALTGCAAQPEVAPTATPKPSASAEPVTTPAPEPAATEQPAESTAEPTCETIIAPSTIEIFEGYGWTFKQDAFRLGEDELAGGLQCIWGDYTVASDHVQVFGWAPLPADESAGAQQKLLAEGWLRADQDGHTYITEPQYSSADEVGDGMTYEFGDGWVTLADTMQSLVLIERP